MKCLVYLILITLGIVLAIALLPFLLLLFLLMLIVQLFTGRSYVRVAGARFRARPQQREPERQDDEEVPASEAIIDAEVVDLPDDFTQLEDDGNSQKTQ